MPIVLDVSLTKGDGTVTYDLFVVHVTHQIQRKPIYTGIPRDKTISSDPAFLLFDLGFLSERLILTGWIPELADHDKDDLEWAARTWWADATFSTKTQLVALNYNLRTWLGEVKSVKFTTKGGTVRKDEYILTFEVMDPP